MDFSLEDTGATMHPKPATQAQNVIIMQTQDLYMLGYPILTLQEFVKIAGVVY